jgi:peptidylprolyl isomerase
MKRLLLAAAAALSCHAAIAADQDPIVAERGSAVITASQARALINGTDQETRHRLTTDPASLQTFLRNVLLQQAILDEAKAQKWDQRPEVAALLQRAHDQVLAQSFLGAQTPLPADFPTDADIKAAYDQAKSRFMQPRTYHVVQIVLPAPAAGHADDGRKRLADLRSKLLRSRMSFEDAAKTLPGARYADPGFVTDTALPDFIKPAIVGLPEGAMTEPLCAPGGCTLLRLVATRPAGPAPIGEVRDQLVRLLREQKERQEANVYASKLLEKQPIQLNEIQLAHLAQSP